MISVNQDHDMNVAISVSKTRWILIRVLVGLTALLLSGPLPAEAQSNANVFGSAPVGTATQNAVGGSRLEPVSEDLYTYKIVNSYPHDRYAFTQGLIFYNGVLYEGTGGRHGFSTIRQVELETGRVIRSRSLESRYFGEGITIFNNRLIQLTWKSKIGFVYNLDNFELLKTFKYTSEGWGITHDGVRLIMSDGSSNLYYVDPLTFALIGRVAVFDRDGPVAKLNELEYIDGQVYANVFQTDRIARIDSQTGRVTGWINLEGLAGEGWRSKVDVLNGIAYDANHSCLFVTGKRWSKLFEIVLIKQGQ